MLKVTTIASSFFVRLRLLANDFQRYCNIELFLCIPAITKVSSIVLTQSPHDRKVGYVTNYYYDVIDTRQESRLRY